MTYGAGPVSKNAMLITCVFVGPHCRGKGLGSELLWLAGEIAGRAGYTALEAFARRGSANNPAGPIELYLRCGFRVFRGDEDFPLIRKDLKGRKKPALMSAEAACMI